VTARLLIAALVSVSVAGCTRSNMDSQPKFSEYESAKLFGNGRSLQAPVRGTVARDQLALANPAQQKPEITDALLTRGQQQFDIFCSPCHDRTGSGNGMIVQRGFPHPPNFHDDRLRQAEDQHFFDVITNGHGAMYGYGDRLAPGDRWAVVAYIRALQLSQHTTPDDLTPEQRATLGLAGKP
jgi:mono/diheme cytochrome c family protein